MIELEPVNKVTIIASALELVRMVIKWLWKFSSMRFLEKDLTWRESLKDASAGVVGI